MKTKEEEEVQASTTHSDTSESNRFEEPGKYFDNYAEEWDTMYAPENAARAHDYVQRENRLLEWVDQKLSEPKKVLEFGCGAGHCAAAMRQRGHQMTALDVSAEMVEATRRRFQAQNLDAEFVVGQIQDLVDERAGQYDLIYALGVMDYIEDLSVSFDAISKLLSPGGRFILSFTNDHTPFRQVEMPLKRGLAKALFTVTGKDKYRDVAKQSSRSHALSEIESIIEARPELRRNGVQYFSYGIRMGGIWFPPYPLVRNSEQIYQNAGADNWGRGFLLFGDKPESEDLSIENIEANGIHDVVKLHEESFAESMGVSLGSVYVTQLLQWFAQTEGAMFLKAQKGSRIQGYVFGAFLEAQASMNRDLMLAAGIGMFSNPAVLLGGPFRKELGRRVQILLGKPSTPDQTSEVDDTLMKPTFSLVGIGVNPEARGQGIAGQLIKEFEEQARKQGALSIRLSVYNTNSSARRAYEKKGYTSFEHPSNPDVLYYGKNFVAEGKND